MVDVVKLLGAAVCYETDEMPKEGKFLNPTCGDLCRSARLNTQSEDKEASLLATKLVALAKVIPNIGGANHVKGTHRQKVAVRTYTI